MDNAKLKKLADLIRYYILVSSTTAGSGHPTSSLSAADLMTVLLFGSHFHFNFENPLDINNDRFLFSKGHATPLYYSLFLAAGQITSEEILTVRKFDSVLEGHPTPRFKFTEAATGSLGQGLSVGVGLSLGIKSSSPENKARVYVLHGDGEIAEGSVWEAANLASYYKLDNLTVLVDVNRLGQSQETSLGWDLDTYKKRFESFGFATFIIDGHNHSEINQAISKAKKTSGKPQVIIAKTAKGHGISFLENKDGWHGKPLKKDELEKALTELGNIDLKIRGVVEKPESDIKAFDSKVQPDAGNLEYKIGDEVASRKAYGNALKRLGNKYPRVISLDGDVKNSTYAEVFKSAFPDRFFEMFIAEQNMVSVAVGMARMGYIPFASSFACFLTRGYDQVRMAALSAANVKFCGSHAGVSIGEDGPSQMGLEDLAMFRAVNGSTVLYPSDAVSTEKLVEEMIKTPGLIYMRTSRPTTPVIYANDEEFKIGGCRVHRVKPGNYKSKAVIIGAGVTLYEALKAQEELVKNNIETIVVDLYSVKPVDEKTLKMLASETENFITVEDHWSEGGIGDAVLNVFAKEQKVKITKLAVTKTPRSGSPAELMAYEEIDAAAIVRSAKSLVG